jgi:hypothetical protein
MDALKFTFRLLKHGGIFVLRVAGILLPVADGALALGDGMKRESESEGQYGCFPDGTPYYENSAHEQWELYHGDKG